MTPLDRQIAAEFRRDAGPSEPVDDAAIFAAITATQSPKWRFPSMFSATKFVVAGAIVALFGGFLLAGVLPDEPTEPQIPAALTESSGPADAASELAVEFGGRVDYRQTEADGRHVYRVWEMTDPRLDGEWVIATTEAWFPSENVPEPRVWHASFRIENEDGAWEEVPNLTLQYPDQTASTRTSVLVGEGEYEGLTAIIELSYVHDTSAHFDVRGVITSAEVPPPPETTATLETAIGPGDSATTSEEPAVEFTGRANWARQSADGVVFRVWEMEDPRLDGEWLVSLDSAPLPSDSTPAPELLHLSLRIENEDGAWTEVPSLQVFYPDGTASKRTSVLIGEGGYEGLTAIVELDWIRDPASAHYLVRGLVTSAELPPPPSHPLSS